MIENKKRQVVRLAVAVILAVSLLIIALIAFTTTAKKQEIISETAQMQKRLMPQSTVVLPRIEDIEGKGAQEATEEAQAEEKEEEVTPAQETMKRLEQLPLEAVSQERKSLMEETQRERQGGLNTQPSLEEMKEIKNKGLLIY